MVAELSYMGATLPYVFVIVVVHKFMPSMGAAQGGESVALARLADQLSDHSWVAAFEKARTAVLLQSTYASTDWVVFVKHDTCTCA